MASAKSIANKKSANRGKWTETIIKQVLKKLGLDMIKPIWVNPIECPDYSMNCDIQLPHLKTFVEVKSSLRDGGLFKIFSQARAFKKAFPNFKFIVIVTTQTSDPRENYKRYLLSNPHIDDVLYIHKDEMGNTITEQKEFLKSKLTIYFEQLMMNHIKSESIKINESKDLDFEDRYVPFLTQPMKNLMDRKKIDINTFRKTGRIEMVI